MSSKNLSTSTLSLRFMQNAQRANKLKEVELDRAEVKDDGKWEVSQAARDTWGLSKDSSSEASDVHEASYLPFIFSGKEDVASELDTDAIVKPATGRRVFNKKGEEVAIQTSFEPASTASASTSALPPQSTGRKIHARPVSISASGTPGQLQGFENLKNPQNFKTARQAIFESGGVGTDLGTQARPNTVTSTSTTFMKPAGIDDPRDVHSSTPAALSNPDKVIDGMRPKKVKRERDRGSSVDERIGMSIKPKKKKKKNPE